MQRYLISLSLALLFIISADETMTAQGARPADRNAVVIYKYSHNINIWSRPSDRSPYEVEKTGVLFRAFATGPKVYYGDQRIPEGIYRARIEPDGSIGFRFETIPGMFEQYRLSGATLDRNTIPMRNDIYRDLTDLAAEMYRDGYRSIPVVILPGTLESDVASLLERARNVEPWQSLDAVRASINRWKPVEEYMIRTGYIPTLHFDGADISIEEPRLSREEGGPLSRR